MGFEQGPFHGNTPQARGLEGSYITAPKRVSDRGMIRDNPHPACTINSLDSGSFGTLLLTSLGWIIAVM